MSSHLTNAVKALRQQHPHGHPEFLPISIGEVALHSDKNHDYAHGGPPLGNFERVGAILGLYPKLDHSQPIVVCLSFLLKQLDAVLWGLNQRIVPKVEGALPRLKDISVYAKIAMCMVKDDLKAQQATKMIGPVGSNHSAHQLIHSKWAAKPKRGKR